MILLVLTRCISKFLNDLLILVARYLETLSQNLKNKKNKILKNVISINLEKLIQFYNKYFKNKFLRSNE